MTKIKKGSSVKVKKGVLDPDMEKYDLTGWQGWVTDIIEPEDEDEERLYEIKWDSITLREQMPKEFVEVSLEDEYEFETMVLGEGQIEIATPRDKKNDAQKIVQELIDEYENGFSGFDDTEKIISEIIGSEDLEVNEKSLRKYLAYIKKNLEKPCLLTGVEMFSWEEKYAFNGNRAEFENQRKNEASCEDTFELVDFEDVKKYDALHVKVQRTSDKKTFVLPLDMLKATDENSGNYQILDVYSVWIANYQ